MMRAVDLFTAWGFATRDTGAIRYGKDDRRVVFVHERANGQVVLSELSSRGTSRHVYKSAGRALAAVVRDDAVDRRSST